MRAAEMWIDSATVTHRRRRLGAVMRLMGLDGALCRYDGERFLSVHRDRFGSSLSTHPTAAAARAHLAALAPGGVSCWLDLDRGGVHFL